MKAANHTRGADPAGHGGPDPVGSPGGEVCPVCGAEAVQEKCKLVCRSATCTYRIIYNCSEF